MLAGSPRYGNVIVISEVQTCEVEGICTCFEPAEGECGVKGNRCLQYIQTTDEHRSQRIAIGKPDFLIIIQVKKRLTN